MKWTVTTVVQTDTTGQTNTDKFYRTFASDSGVEVRQNGRIGALGQFQWFNRGSGNSAQSSASTQISTKLRGGYYERTESIFTYPDDKTPTSRDDARHLANAFQASGQPGSNPAALSDQHRGVAVATPTAAAPAEAVPELDALLQEALDGINAAIADKGTGMQVYIDLKTKVEEASGKLAQVKSYHETLETLVLS